METKGIQGDTFTNNAAILACEKSCIWDQGLRLALEMEARGVPLDSISYSAAITACEKVGRPDAISLSAHQTPLFHRPAV